jgi:plasmid stabilization system protein ParE
MARPVRWTEGAADDLEQIAQYVARDSEHYAAALVAEILEAAQSLEEFSERGREVPELREPNTRQLVVGSYRLVYEIRREAVYVVGVIHGARDFGRMWKGKGFGKKGEGR